MKFTAPDLRKQPPRSPRVRLGGFAVLPRILDKCRATLADQNGEYSFNCPLDKRFFIFVGIKAEAFRKQVALGKGDWDLLQWVLKTARTPRTPVEIEAWSAWQDRRVATELGSREYFHKLHKGIAPHREDIGTWFDLLDLDDYVSFGGRA